jgi:hypothetical protein
MQAASAGIELHTKTSKELAQSLEKASPDDEYTNTLLRILVRTQRERQGERQRQ